MHRKQLPYTPVCIEGCEGQSALPHLLPMHRSSRDLLSRARECDLEMKEQLHSCPRVGDFLYHEDLFYASVVRLNTDNTYECLRLISNEFRPLSYEQVVQGIRNLKEIEGENLLAVQAKLPAWAFHTQAALTSGFLSTGVGPVIPWLRMGAVGHVFLQVAILLWSQHRNNAHSKWVCVAIVVCASFPRIFLELWALRHVLPYFSRRCEFKVCHLEVPLKMFLAVHFSLSQLSFIDITTDSLFISSAMHILQRRHSEVEIWRQVWQQSTLCALPMPNFWLVSVSCWALSLLQMIVPVLRTVRWSDMQLTTQNKFRDMGASTLIWSNEEVRHAAVLESLADANGMMMLQATILPTYAAKLFSDAGFADPQERVRRRIQANVHLANLICSRVFLSYFLENALQLNIQATIYGISIAASRVTKAEFGFQTLGHVSFACTIATSFLKLLEVGEFFKVAAISAELASSSRECEAAQRHNATIQRRVCFVGFACVLLVSSLTYAIIKLVMAHICQDAVWNLNGCVTLHL